MILKTFKSNNLDIKVFDTRNDMGKAAAADVAACIKETLGRKKGNPHGLRRRAFTERVSRSLGRDGRH